MKKLFRNCFILVSLVLFTITPIALADQLAPAAEKSDNLAAKTFIVTRVDDGLDIADATIMINRLTSLGYKKILENPNVTSNNLKAYLARKDITILYHTGHGSTDGLVLTADGTLVASKVPIANETSIFATCLTAGDTNFKKHMQPTCLNVMGYTNYSYDFTDDEVVNKMADAMEQGNSIVKSWYLANAPIDSLNDRWLEYCREGNKIVEYSARSGNVPKNSFSWQSVNGQSNIKINNQVLANSPDFSGKFSLLANTSVRVQSSTKLTETYANQSSKQPFVHKSQTADEAVQIAEKWLNTKKLLPQDFVLDSITPVSMTIDNNSTTIAHTLRYVRSLSGLNVKNNINAEHITLIVNDSKVVAMTKLVNNISAAKMGIAEKINVLPVKKALEIAAPQISRILKAPECKIADVRPCYSYANHRLVPAYELIDETGSSLIISAATGKLIF